MQVVTSVEALRKAVASIKQTSRRVGFVPTMGNLHEGHLALIHKAREHADFVIASIFVNPMQFGEGEDFERYPRTHDADKVKLQASHCDLLFLPDVETMYPVPAAVQTRVEVPGISDWLCGASRPGHFVGVATVVTKLFNLVQPDVAVFGEKDFQQLMVIRRMTEELCMPVDIIGAPIVREPDGLAMSSRNHYLNKDERRQAVRLFAELSTLRDQLISGERDFVAAAEVVAGKLNAQGFKTDYIEIRRGRDLLPPQEQDSELVILAAAYMGNTRLIDNLTVNLGN